MLFWEGEISSNQWLTRLSETNQVYLFWSSRMLKQSLLKMVAFDIYNERVDLETGLFRSPSKNEPA